MLSELFLQYTQSIKIQVKLVQTSLHTNISTEQDSMSVSLLSCTTVFQIRAGEVIAKYPVIHKT